MVDVYSSNWLLPRYGMMAMDYANVWPELTTMLGTFYRDKLATLPWVPADFRSSIGTLHGKEGKLLVPVSSRASADNGERIRFLDTPEKAAVWDRIVAEVDAIRQTFVNNKRWEGQRLMQIFQNQAAFWNTAVNVATVAALPVTAARAIVNNPKTTLVGVALVVGGFLVLRYFFSKDSK